MIVNMKKILLVIFTIWQINVFCQIADGQFVYTDTIQSVFLEEGKPIYIYLPPDFYHSNDHYPLQIVLGSHSRTQMYYSISNYLSSPYHMIALNQLHSIPESIIIGVGNPNADNLIEYEQFITEEVIPFIEQKIRNCHYKVIIGHSRGGELVLRSLFNEKSPFHAFYCSAPVNSAYFMEELSNKRKSTFLKGSKKRLFIAASEQDYFYKGNRKLIEAFNEIKSPSFLFESIIKANDNHHTIFPVTQTDALFFCFKDWKFVIPANDSTSMTEAFQKHYIDLSEKTGIELYPPEFDFYVLAYVLNERNQIDEKIKLLETCKRIYPKAINADAYLARTFYSIGNLKKARLHNEFSLSINPDNDFALKTKELIEKAD